MEIIAHSLYSLGMVNNMQANIHLIFKLIKQLCYIVHEDVDSCQSSLLWAKLRALRIYIMKT